MLEDSWEMCYCLHRLVQVQFTSKPRQLFWFHLLHTRGLDQALCAVFKLIFLKCCNVWLDGGMRLALKPPYHWFFKLRTSSTGGATVKCVEHMNAALVYPLPDFLAGLESSCNGDSDSIYISSMTRVLSCAPFQWVLPLAGIQHHWEAMYVGFTPKPCMWAWLQIRSCV